MLGKSLKINKTGLKLTVCEALSVTFSTEHGQLQEAAGFASLFLQQNPLQAATDSALRPTRHSPQTSGQAAPAHPGAARAPPAGV